MTNKLPVTSPFLNFGLPSVLKMIKRLFYIACIALLFSSCHSSINVDALYGKWKYIKVDNPNASPPDSVKKADLAEQSPYIEFRKNNELTIVWGGKILSHGKFSIDGMNIRYKETLPDGKFREFPFWVSKLTDKELVFETSGEDGSKVTAVKLESH
jgi:hypothetical protein